MERLARNRSCFVGLSCLSLACLIGSFANPLQKLEVWRQTELGNFDLEYQRTFIITENDVNYPYGFDADRAVKISRIYHDYKSEKILLLISAFVSAYLALQIGDETCRAVEIDVEISELKTKGRKELLIEGVKHKLAMASKSQRLLFMDEMKALIEEFGSGEGELLEADELNATDKFTNASYLLADGLPIDTVVEQVWGVASDSPSHRQLKGELQQWLGESDDSPHAIEAVEDSFRGLFPFEMDSTAWKGICKAMGEQASREDIVKDVLGCTPSQMNLGLNYLDFLRGKFGG